MKRPDREPASTLFFRNHYLLAVSIVVILAAGASALLNLPRLEDPRITNRFPIVITMVPGASAERVENLVTEKIEEHLQEVAAIKNMESTSRAGVSIIAIELEDAVTAETQPSILSQIRDKLADALPELPNEALPPIFDDKRDPAAFTLILGITWMLEGEPQLGILNRLAEDLADRLRNVAGTELVRIYAEPEEEITVVVDADELTALGLTTADVAAKIRAADAKVPAGALRGHRVNLQIEVTGELDSTRRVAAVPLREGPNGAVIRLDDVAVVTRGWRNPPREIGMVDGRRSVFVAARMNTRERIDIWADAAQRTLAAFRETTGEGIEVKAVFEQSVYTNDQLAALGGTLVAGAGVVIAVVFLMMGWRLALIVGVALPLTASLTLFGIQLGDGAIHQMTIYGMIVALGLLIDNAIVVADEVTKFLAAGYDRAEAVQKAVGHLFRPLLASTLTTVLAFAPIVLLPGAVGDFVDSIGRSVIMALVFSLLVAMTIVAALTGRFSKPTTGGKRQAWWRDGVRSERLSASYRRGLLLGLRFPAAAILVATFLPALGFVLAPTMRNEFFPPVDRNMFHVRMWLPTESSVHHTQAQAAAVEATMRQHAEVEHVYWLVGGSFPTVYYNLVMNKDDSRHYAQAIVTTRSNEDTKEVIPLLQRRLDDLFPGAQIVVRQFGQGPPIDADLEFRLFGPSIKRLQDLGDEIRLVLQAHPEVLHTQATMERGEPKLWLDADEDEARLAGFTLRDVAAQMQANLEGGVGGSVLEHLEEMPVRIRYADARRGDLSHIASTNLVRRGAPNDSQQWVPLSAIGEITLRPELAGITRYNGVRTNIVKGYTRNGALPIQVHKNVSDELKDRGFKLPAGYWMDFGGTVEEDTEANANLIIYAPALAISIVSILILTFRSVRLAGLLGVVAFSSVGLGLLSTWAIQFPISFNTILGTLGLIGVAFNDSIVVLAAIRANPEARRGNHRAIADEIVGTSRHVISTTLTTIGGFLPLLIFVGGDFWPSLAIVLVGGVGGAMILALLFIPASYVLLQRGSEDEATLSNHEDELVLEGGAA